MTFKFGFRNLLVHSFVILGKKCLSFVTNGDRNVSLVLFFKKCVSDQ